MYIYKLSDVKRMSECESRNNQSFTVLANAYSIKVGKIIKELNNLLEVVVPIVVGQ